MAQGIQIIVGATNNAGSVFNSINSQSRNLFNSLQNQVSRTNTSMQNFNQNMNMRARSIAGSMSSSFHGMSTSFQTAMQNMDVTLQSFGESMKKVGANMTKFITLPILGFGALSVKTAASAEELESKFNTVFGEMANDVNKWAKEYANSINRGELSVRNYLANQQNMLVGFGATRKEASELSKNLISLGYDLASFNDMSDEDAIRRVSSAMMGETEAAKMLGTVLSENNLKVAMEHMGLKGKFQTLTELEKVQVRYTSMVLQSTDAIGNAGRESGSFTSMLKGTIDMIKDVSVGFGELMLPVLKDFLVTARDFLKWVNGLSEGNKKLVIGIGIFLAVLGPLLTMIGTGIVAFAGLTTVMGAFGISMTAALGPIGLVLAGITALIAIAPLIIKHWDGISSFFQGLWISIKEGMTSVLLFLGKATVTIVDFITAPFRNIFNMISKLGNMVGLNIPKAEGFSATLPSFDVGTNYVQRDMVAKIHEGEMIVPKKYNPNANGNLGNGGNSQAPVINIYIDSRMIATATAPHLVNEIRLRTGGAY